MAPKQLVWLITGTSSGIGKELTLAALRRGDRVIATARNISKIDPALKSQGADILQLDVTDSLENLKKIASEAAAIHGRVDVLVNNAGYIAVGALEEVTPEETFQQFNTNVFGALNVSRAFLPAMRERKSGTIFFIGSVAGWGGGPGVGLYIGTKHAIRGLAESLSLEVAPLGIKVYNLEPGYFRTDLLAPGNRSSYDPRIADYSPVTQATQDSLVSHNGKQTGDPVKLVEIMTDIARGEGAVGEKGEVPVTLPFGSDSWKVIKGELATRGKMLDDWKSVIESTDF
ncbi:hypothetical protein FRB94_013312 [Tulasnella sp. JGI-2019a]|nr:hypothetical protein FRB93_011511 [Tulasnella sp. JGI-2019a]KAG9008390.1 hypothetical protein FRB94_013312 [Tulasnella sp. JGI-2019a]KAG9030090.1 hypothetical protein FRB95_004330 [Tulasnella sp. JGI-2019a]